MPRFTYRWTREITDTSSSQEILIPLKEAAQDEHQLHGCTLFVKWAPAKAQDDLKLRGEATIGIRWGDTAKQRIALAASIFYSISSTSWPLIWVVKLAETEVLPGASGRVEASVIERGGSHTLRPSENFGLCIVAEVRDLPNPPRSEIVPVMPPRLPFQSPVLFQRSHPNNVEFVFLRENISLWANATLLKAASPYLAGLLTSEFSEGKPISVSLGSKVAESPSLDSMDSSDEEEEHDEPFPPEYFDDSDSEDSRKTLLPTDPPQLGPSPPRHVIKVTGFEAVTYLAVLNWIYSGDIKFATLRSLSQPNPITDVPLASPKSVYRLCHFLEISSLKKYALDSYKAQLTVECAASELYSNLSGVFDEVREGAIDFVCDHWKEVKGSKGMEEVSREIKDGKRPFAGMIGTELIKRF